MIVPSPSLPARRGSGEGAGEPEKRQEHRTFAHVLHAPASRSFSRAAAAKSSLGDNRRRNTGGHVHHQAQSKDTDEWRGSDRRQQ